MLLMILKLLKKQVGSLEDPDIEIQKDVPSAGTSTLKIKITY